MDTIDDNMDTVDNNMVTIDNDMDTIDNDKSTYFWEFSAPARALFIQEYHLGQPLLAALLIFKSFLYNVHRSKVACPIMHQMWILSQISQVAFV